MIEAAMKMILFGVVSAVGLAEATITNDPVLIGLLIGLPASIVGFLGYRRTLKVDELARETEASTARTKENRGIIKGQDRFINTLQKEIKEQRTLITDLRGRVERLEEQLRIERT